MSMSLDELVRETAQAMRMQFARVYGPAALTVIQPTQENPAGDGLEPMLKAAMVAAMALPAAHARAVGAK